MAQNVTQLNVGDKQIYILGTAHVSADSAEEAYNLIKEIHPESVLIELDEERFESIKNPKKWQDTDIFTVIKEKKAAFLLVNLILSSYQKRMATSLNVQVGEEMIKSIRASEEINARIVPIDRNIKTTFLRIWRKINLFSKLKLIFNLIFSFLDDEGVSEEDLAQLKQQDMLSSALSELGQQFPQIKEYLVDERDIFLSQMIKNAHGKLVVAVVGAAHVPGICEHIKEDIDISEINTVPKASAVSKVIGWGIPALILYMIIATLIKDFSAGLEQMKQWVLYNGILSALGTIIAGGHILSILTAFVCAPITSLNPLLAAGWFAGLTEAYMRKPTVKDFEALSNDLGSVKGLWKNKITKVLLVVVLANLGSVLGTYLGGIEIFKIFRNI